VWLCAIGRLAQHGLAGRAGFDAPGIVDAVTFIQGTMDQLQGVVHVERLGQVFEGAALKRRDRRIEVGIGGHDDHGQARMLGLQAFHEIQTAHAGHADVGQHRARSFLVEGAQGGFGAVEDAVRQVFPSQGLFEHPADGTVVVDDPDRFHLIGR